MNYAKTITLDLPYADAVSKVKEAFEAEGFGTLTEIDVKATLADKTGKEVEDYIILGVCNPELAWQALDVDRTIGLLLPCDVVVRSGGDGTTVVDALDAIVLSELNGKPELRDVAADAARRIDAALEALQP